jgi:nucleoside-diphosphate-sugar epimerase
MGRRLRAPARFVLDSYTADFARIPALADRPHRFKRPVLLIVGCGDVGLRVVHLLRDRWRILALTSSPERVEALRAAGATPLQGDLDQAATLARLAGLADTVLHLAPPAGAGVHDQRTAHLLRALARSTRLRRLVYASTSGVYGDCAGEWVDETRAPRPTSDRARRRADAERRVRLFGRSSGVAITLLRVPGFYAIGRPDGDPRERLARGAAVLAIEDDVFTNHIHADDLARACVAALSRGLPQRAVNVCDDTVLRMGDYFDLAADVFGSPRPPRVSRAEATTRFSAAQLSFMDESRRLVNRRLKTELRLVLRHPTVASGLRASPD